MKKITIGLCLIIVMVTTVRSQNMLKASQSKDSIEYYRAMNQIIKRFGGAGPKIQCEMCDSCVTASYPGYEGYPIYKCFYKKIDKTGIKKNGIVYLLNPTKELAARWIINACIYAKGQINDLAIKKIYARIMNQSGFQFPVAGIHYEDMIRSGIHRAWMFRDGVTVKLKGLRSGTSEQLSSDEIERSLTAEVLDTYSLAGPARIISTKRLDYLTVLDPHKNLSGVLWLALVRELYLQAWKTGNNTLINIAVKNQKLYE